MCKLNENRLMLINKENIKTINLIQKMDEQCIKMMLLMQLYKEASLIPQKLLPTPNVIKILQYIDMVNTIPEKIRENLTSYLKGTGKIQRIKLDDFSFEQFISLAQDMTGCNYRNLIKLLKHFDTLNTIIPSNRIGTEDGYKATREKIESSKNWNIGAWYTTSSTKVYIIENCEQSTYYSSRYNVTQTIHTFAAEKDRDLFITVYLELNKLGQQLAQKDIVVENSEKVLTESYKQKREQYENDMTTYNENLEMYKKYSAMFDHPPKKPIEPNEQYEFNYYYELTEYGKQLWNAIKNELCVKYKNEYANFVRYSDKKLEEIKSLSERENYRKELDPYVGQTAIMAADDLDLTEVTEDYKMLCLKNVRLVQINDQKVQEDIVIDHMWAFVDPMCPVYNFGKLKIKVSGIISYYEYQGEKNIEIRIMEWQYQE